MPEIPVTYKCWGCTSEVVVYEKIAEDDISALTKWNLCPVCIEKNKEIKDNGTDKNKLG